MLDAKELVEEYMRHYECAKEKAIEMVLEDIELARKELIEESIRISVTEEANNGKST